MRYNIQRLLLQIRESFLLSISQWRGKFVIAISRPRAATRRRVIERRIVNLAHDLVADFGFNAPLEIRLRYPRRSEYGGVNFARRNEMSCGVGS